MLLWLTLTRMTNTECEIVANIEAGPGLPYVGRIVSGKRSTLLPWNWEWHERLGWDGETWSGA
jgi:hypothetical protein